MNIKFRVWHKEENRMYYVLTMEQINTKHMRIISAQGDVFSINQIELMRSTGLQDKEGKDIFEGDILVYDFVGGVDSFVVERCVHSNQLIIKYLYMYGDWEHLDDAPLESSIIIGNIYENPELLNDTGS